MIHFCPVQLQQIAEDSKDALEELLRRQETALRGGKQATALCTEAKSKGE